VTERDGDLFRIERLSNHVALRPNPSGIAAPAMGPNETQRGKRRSANLTPFKPQSEAETSA
jgi:hypothetical protein